MYLESDESITIESMRDRIAFIRGAIEKYGGTELPKEVILSYIKDQIDKK